MKKAPLPSQYIQNEIKQIITSTTGESSNLITSVNLSPSHPSPNPPSLPGALGHLHFPRGILSEEMKYPDPQPQYVIPLSSRSDHTPNVSEKTSSFSSTINDVNHHQDDHSISYQPIPPSTEMPSYRSRRLQYS